MRRRLSQLRVAPDGSLIIERTGDIALARAGSLVLEEEP